MFDIIRCSAIFLLVTVSVSNAQPLSQKSKNTIKKNCRGNVECIQLETEAAQRINDRQARGEFDLTRIPACVELYNSHKAPVMSALIGNYDRSELYRFVDECV